MQDQLQSAKAHVKSLEIELSQMTFSRDEAKGALKEIQAERDAQRLKLEQSAISLFKAKQRVSELEARVGAWPASSDRPAPQRFLDEVKRFEGKTDAVLNQCHGLISGQQIKLAKVGSHLYVVKTLLDRRSASIAQKEAQIAEERRKLDDLKREHGRTLQSSGERAGKLSVLKEKLIQEESHIEILESNLQAAKADLAKATSRCEDLATENRAMKAEMTALRGKEEALLARYNEEQKHALVAQFELKALQSSERRMEGEKKEMEAKERELQDQLLAMQKSLAEMTETSNARDAQLNALLQGSPMRTAANLGASLSAATPGTRLLGTIDTLFSQAGPAPALEVGNRLRTLSQILVSLSQASKQQPLLLLLSNNKGVTKHPIAHGRTFERKGDEKRRKKLTRSFAFAPPFPLPIASAKGQQETKAFKDANPNGQRDASVPSRGPRFSRVAA